MQTDLLEFFRSTRQRFPALGRTVGDRPAVFFDGPAGTQVPDIVIRAVDEYFTTCNANHGGAFLTSRVSDAMMREAQQAYAESSESLPAYKVRPALDQIPDRWMTGTPAFELIAGARACVEYLAELGRGGAEKGKSDGSTRDALAAAFGLIEQYERELVQRLIAGLQDIPGIRVFGITDPNEMDQRFSTVSIAHERVPASEIANRLADAGIFVWHGNYYALEWSARLGLEPEGAVRIGLVHYNTPEEVDRLLLELRETIAVKA